MLSCKFALVRNTQKNLPVVNKLMFCWHLKSHLTEKRRIRIRNPVYGSKDPDPPRNVTDPEHCFAEILETKSFFASEVILRKSSKLLCLNICTKQSREYRRVKVVWMLVSVAICQLWILT